MNKYQEALSEIKKVSINIRAIPKHYCDVICSQANILQELVDRATPKKPIEVTTLFEGWKKDALKNGWIVLNPKLCGNCKQETQWKRSVGENKWDYCPYCGQAIDWTNESEQIAKGETK